MQAPTTVATSFDDQSTACPRPSLKNSRETRAAALRPVGKYHLKREGGPADMALSAPGPHPSSILCPFTHVPNCTGMVRQGREGTCRGAMHHYLEPPLAMPAVAQHFLHQSPGDPGFTGQTSLCVVDHRHPHWVVRYDLTRWSFPDEGQATASGSALNRMPTKSRCNDAT